MAGKEMLLKYVILSVCQCQDDLSWTTVGYPESPVIGSKHTAFNVKDACRLWHIIPHLEADILLAHVFAIPM